MKLIKKNVRFVATTVGIVVCACALVSANIMVSDVKMSNENVSIAQGTTIMFTLNEPATVYVRVMDTTETVLYRKLWEARYETTRGQKSVVWNGLDDSDDPVSTGTYRIVIRAGSNANTSARLLGQYATDSMDGTYKFNGIFVNKNIGDTNYGKVFVSVKTSNGITGANADSDPLTQSDGKVMVFTSTTGYCTQLAAPTTIWGGIYGGGWDDDGPIKPVIDSEGYIYVADWFQGGTGTSPNAWPSEVQNQIVYRYNPDGTNPVAVLSYQENNSGTFKNFTVIGSSNTKKIVTAAVQRGRVEIYNVFDGIRWTSPRVDGTVITSVVNIADQLKDVAVDSNNNYYVVYMSTTLGSKVVEKYDINGISQWSKTTADFDAVYATREGVGCVLDIYSSTSTKILYINKGGYIVKLNADTGAVIGLTYVSYAEIDMDVDTSGNLYVCSHGSAGKGWWKIIGPDGDNFYVTTGKSVYFLATTTSPVSANVVISQNPVGTNDTVEGNAGAVIANAVVEVYSKIDLTSASLVVSTVAASNGSFGPLSIGDNLYDNVWVVAYMPGWAKSGKVLLRNDIVSPESVPLNVSVKVSSTTDGLVVTWSKDSNAAMYNIYRATYVFTSVAGMVCSTTTAGLNWTDIGIESGKSYLYAVTSLDTAGNEDKTKCSVVSKGMLILSTADFAVTSADTNGTQVVGLNIANGDLSAKYSVVVSTFTSSSLAVNDANDTVRNDSRYKTNTGIITAMNYFDITFKDYNGNAVSQPCASGKTVTMTVKYTQEFEAAISGIIDESTLKLVHLDSLNRVWEPVYTSVVDTVNNTVTAEVSQFSVFSVLPCYGLASTVKSNLNNATVYPNPYINADSVKKSIIFTNLTTTCKIYIYDISGTLVWWGEETNGDGYYEWNVKNDDGQEVMPGLYIYLLKHGSEKKVGNLAVIR
ncbi:MAG: T9SS type A sorting domain-containing protein [Elusimicrobiota bacterium]